MRTEEQAAPRGVPLQENKRKIFAELAQSGKWKCSKHQYKEECVVLSVSLHTLNAVLLAPLLPFSLR